MIIESQNIMQIREIIVESAGLPSVTVAKANINRILAVTQQVYDDWDESDQDTYAGGGICHIIADAISDVLWKLNIEATPISCSYEQHVYVAAKFEEGVYTIDIPYHIYETGGGFSWKKIPDIQFDARDVVFYRVTSDPSEFDNYVGEDIEYVVEKRRRKKRSRSRGAAFGPGPYGVYGYLSGYSGDSSSEGVAEGLEEAVGGNYLYHATDAVGAQGILQSGSILAASGPQPATQAQTKMPTVSVTRDWRYASGASQTQSQMAGIGRDVVFVLDRNAVESNFKTLSTSQSTQVKGLAFNPYLKKNGEARSQNTDPMARANAKAKSKYAEPSAKAGGEFEEAVIVPKGALPLKGTMVGFWVNPKSKLISDPIIMNDPRRLDIVRPNQFVKQGVAEENLKEFAPGPDFRDDDDRQDIPLLEFAKIIKLFLGSEYTMIDRKTPEQVSVKFDPKDRTSGHNGAVLYSVVRKQNEYPTVNFQLIDYVQGPQVGRGRRAGTAILKTRANALKIADIIYNTMGLPQQDRRVEENFADGRKPGRKGLAKRVGVNCKQSVSKLRSIAAKSSGERQRMAHWCANMKSGKRK